MQVKQTRMHSSEMSNYWRRFLLSLLVFHSFNIYLKLSTLPNKLFYFNNDSIVSSVHVATQIVTFQFNAFMFWVRLCGENWQKYVAEKG
jgi:hypothetical protein